MFEVKALGFPPAEPESQSRTYFGNVNYFGGPNDISCKSSIALSQAQLSIDTMIVFLSDVWLDSPNVCCFSTLIIQTTNLYNINIKSENSKVMERLQTLFIGYSECPPYAFVMFGNFLSEFNCGLRCDELSGSQISFFFNFFQLLPASFLTINLIDSD